MKISKQYLKQVIKEEIQHLLEQVTPGRYTVAVNNNNYNFTYNSGGSIIDIKDDFGNDASQLQSAIRHNISSWKKLTNVAPG